MVKRLLYLAVLLLLCASAFAGTCPSGANYVSLTSPGAGGNAGSVTLATQGQLQCYYVSSSGLDSNTGADESHPWLHLPQMSSATGNAASHSTISGDAFIIEGGSTYHFTTGSPLTGGTITISTNATATNPVYVGIDPTWFSGGSFARPIFSMDNPLSTGFVSGCSAADDSASHFFTVSGSHVIVDGLEFSGSCWNGNPSGNEFNDTGTNNVVERMYMHGWTAGGAEGVVNTSGTSVTYVSGTQFTTGTSWNGSSITINGTVFTVSSVSSATSLTLTGSAGTQTGVVYYNLTGAASDDTWRFAGGGGGLTNSYYYNVIDGSDSTQGTICNSSSCVASVWNGSGTPPVIPATLWPFDDCGTLAYNIIQHTSQGCQAGSIGIVHDNWFNFVFEPGYGRHGNVIETLSQSTGSYIAYNNITSNVNEGENWNPAAPTMVIYNNVFVNDQHFPPDGNCLLVEPHGNNASAILSVTFTNNSTDGTCMMTGHAGSIATGSSFIYENNHIADRTVIFTGGTAFFNCGGSGNVCTTETDNGGEVFQTTSAANAQGYTIANFWEPTLITNATVGAGNNMTTSCGTGGYTTDLCSGRGGVSLGSSWGGEIVVYPAITVNSRPSGAAWDSGAYEFNSGSYTITVSSITGLGTVTSSDSVINCSIATTGTCTDSTASGSVTLTATPFGNYTFTGWGGGTCSGSSTTCTVSAAATVTASFTIISNPTLPQIWVDNNEATDGATPAQQYELNLGTQSWISSVPTGCSSIWPSRSVSYWTVGSPTASGLQQAVNDVENCRTTSGGSNGIIVDIPPSVYAYTTSTGLIIPQTNSSVATAFITLRSTMDSSLPAGRVVCTHGIQDNLSTSTDIGLVNSDCTGQNMYYWLGPTSTTPAFSGANTASMSGTTATFTLPSGITFPSSFTVGQFVKGQSFSVAGYNAYWQILSGGNGTNSMTAQACVSQRSSGGFVTGGACESGSLNLTLSGVSVSAGVATYSGTITGGSNNNYGGLSFPITGFTNSGNNVTCKVTSNTSSQFTCAATTQVNESHSANVSFTGLGSPATTNFTLTAVTVSGGTATYNGTITGGGSSAFAGMIMNVTGFTTSGNNVSCQVVTSTGTNFTCTATTQANETDPANAASITATFAVDNTLAGITTLSVNTTTLTAIPATGNNYVFLANGYVAPGVSITIDSGGNQETGVTTLSGPNQNGMIASFSKTHAAGVPVTYNIGNFTLANGVSTNTSAYNDQQYMWQVTTSGASPTVLTFCNAAATVQAPLCTTSVNQASVAGAMPSTTATFTAGSNFPTGFSVGAYVNGTGFTPGGYNTVWLIASGGAGSTTMTATCVNACSALGSTSVSGTLTLTQNIGGDHWYIEDGGFSPSVGNAGGNNTVELSNGGPTATTQLPTHIHLRKTWSHGDWTSLATGANLIGAAYHLQANYLSLVDSYNSESLKPGEEGHGIAFGLSETQKINHDVIEGNAIGMICGGFGPNAETIPGFLSCTDFEWRRIHTTFPYAWLGISNVPINTNPLVTTANWSLVRKNAIELKQVNRIVRSGIIGDNVDNSGGQQGPNGDMNNWNASGGGYGTNYQSVITNVYDVNHLWRNICNAYEFSARGAGSFEGTGGTALAGGNILIQNQLFYNVSLSNPGCGTNSLAIDDAVYEVQYTGTVTRNAAGTQSTFTAVNAIVNSVSTPASGLSGFSQTDIAVGDGVVITSCTDTSFNTPIGPITGSGAQTTSGVSATMSGTTATFTSGTNFTSQFTAGMYLSGSGFTPSGYNTFWLLVSGGSGTTSLTATCVSNCSGLANTTVSGSLTTKNYSVLGALALTGTNGTSANGLTVVYPNSGAASGSDSSGTCTLGYVQGLPSALQLNHITMVTDTTHSLTATQTTTDQSLNYGTNNAVVNSLWLGGGWFNNALGEGTYTESANWDNTTLAAHHNVWVGRTNTKYTEYNNNTAWPETGCTGTGCSPPNTMYFPSGTTMCTGNWVNSTGCNTANGAPLTLSDYHGYALQSGSPYFAGNADDAADGTSMGANISAIDTAQTVNIFTCPYTCGSPGPFVDTQAPVTSLPSFLLRTQ